jgi:hypothetical protein
MRSQLVAGTLALTLLGSAAAWAQQQPSGTPDAGNSPQGQIPGPNATPPQAEQNSSRGETSVQPVPGAMPGSDAVPSRLSEKNAADDKLPVLAYTFKDLSTDQRRAIYQAVGAKPPASAATAAAGLSGADLGSVLPESIPLAAMPESVVSQLPRTKGFQYVKAGDKLLVVAPANRIVVGVFTP